MCILFIAIEQCADFPLIIAANRDEFYNRPTRPSYFWNTQPDMLAGRDLQAGGTWMGINRQGSIAALTNIRDPHRVDPTARSRGELPVNYLTANGVNNADYHQYLVQSRKDYNGYNLLFGHWRNMWVYNSHRNRVDKLSAGVFGLSNAELNSTWPKINMGVTSLAQHCESSQRISTARLFELLKDTTRAEDHLLPQTGVASNLEKALSSIFVHLDGYGTRSSTLLMIDRRNRVLWLERSYDHETSLNTQKNYSFSLK